MDPALAVVSRPGWTAPLEWRCVLNPRAQTWLDDKEKPRPITLRSSWRGPDAAVLAAGFVSEPPLDQLAAAECGGRVGGTGCWLYFWLKLQQIDKEIKKVVLFIIF